MEWFNAPITVNFILTNNCNANCLFCSIKNNKQSVHKFVAFDKIKKLIDIFKQNGILRINFFGGEPFIYPNIVEAIRYAKQKGFYVSTVSNGLNINENICEKISGYLDVIGISVHGSEKNHNELMGIENSFQKAENAIKFLSANNIPVGLNMTVTAINYTDVKTLTEYMKKKYDIKFVALNRFIPNKYLDDHINKKLTPTIKQLERTLVDLEEISINYPDMNLKYAIHFPHCLIEKKNLRKYIGRCGFGEQYCSIDMDGNMQMCSYGGPILGNVFEEEIKEIWNNNNILKLYRTERWMPENCKKCKEKNECVSGCKVSSGIYPFAPDLFLKKKGE